MMIVNWFHLDFNSVKSPVYSATYQKINIRYLKFGSAACFCHFFFFCISFLKCFTCFTDRQTERLRGEVFMQPESVLKLKLQSTSSSDCFKLFVPAGDETNSCCMKQFASLPHRVSAGDV